MSKIFRKVSLEKLSSPEQLDQLMHVTTPKGWFALLSFIFLIICTIIWGIFGSIPEKINGKGILIKTGGVFDVSVSTSGKITDISIIPGDKIIKGDIIARIEQPEMIQKINSVKEKLKELNIKKEETIKFGGTKSKINEKYIEQQRANIELSIKNSKETLKFLKNKIISQKKLLKQGLITKQTLLNTKENYNNTNKGISSALNQLTEISKKEIDAKRNTEIEINSIDQNIAEVNRNISDLQKKFNLMTQIITPYSGRVLEVKYKIGDIINPGSSIVSMELTGKEIKNLEAVLYFPVAEGKKIKPGMNVQVSPSTVKREEYGCMLAKVTNVSEFPASYQVMMKTLGDERLVDTLSGKGAPIEIHSDLVPDPNTFSKFKWSSPEGPPIKIYSGTVCNVSITLNKKRPISYVIPLLKKYSGL